MSHANAERAAAEPYTERDRLVVAVKLAEAAKIEADRVYAAACQKLSAYDERN